MVNVFSDDWQGGRDRPGYTWKTMRIAGAMLGASVYELPPGQKSFPYHLHHANEEQDKVGAYGDQLTPQLYLRSTQVDYFEGE